MSIETRTGGTAFPQIGLLAKPRDSREWERPLALRGLHAARRAAPSQVLRGGPGSSRRSAPHVCGLLSHLLLSLCVCAQSLRRVGLRRPHGLQRARLPAHGVLQTRRRGGRPLFLQGSVPAQALHVASPALRAAGRFLAPSRRGRPSPLGGALVSDLLNEPVPVL